MLPHWRGIHWCVFGKQQNVCCYVVILVSSCRSLWLTRSHQRVRSLVGLQVLFHRMMLVTTRCPLIPTLSSSILSKCILLLFMKYYLRVDSHFLDGPSVWISYSKWFFYNVSSLAWVRHVQAAELLLCLAVWSCSWFHCLALSLIHTHTHTQPFYGSVEFVQDNPVELVPEKTFTHYTHRGHQSSQSGFSIYYDPWYPPYSIHVLYSLFPQSLQVFFGLPRGLLPSALYSIHFFTQSLSSFRSTCPYHRNLFRCSTEMMSSNSSLRISSLLGTLSCNFTPHIYLTILISAVWSATSFSFLTSQVSLPCNILLRTQLLYNLPLTINDISLLVSNGTNCLNLFHPIQILVSTAALASPSTLNMSPKWQNLFTNSRFASLPISTRCVLCQLVDLRNLYK